MTADETGPPSPRAVAVTGAGSGIGRATALAFAAAGDHVWALDLDEDRAAATAEAIEAEGGTGWAIALDVADPAAARAVFARVTEVEGRLDVLVNSAGITAVADVEATTPELFERVWRVNVLGVLNCIQAALPGLRAAPPPARVLNVASVAAKHPSPYLAAYAASKSAVVSLTHSAAVTLAPHVLVNAVCPGAIDTPMWDVVGAGLEEMGAPRSRSAEERGAKVPLQRPGRAEEVAALLFALAGPAGAYVTGEDVNVNGGSVMW